MVTLNKPANSTYELPYESRGTRTDIGNPKKLQCEAKGGIWDEASGTCIIQKVDYTKGIFNQPPSQQPAKPLSTQEVMALPKGEGTPIGQTTQQPNVKPTTPEIFVNEKGVPGGIRLPDGRTFLGLSPDEVNEIAAREQAKTRLPEGTQLVGTAANAAQKQQRTQELLQMAQQGLLTPEELRAIGGADVDIGQALGAGGIAVAPGLLGGAITGAGLGMLGSAAAGAGTGAAMGAAFGPLAIATGALGGLTGFIYGVRNSIKGQQTNEFAKDQAALSRGRTYLKFLVADTNSNPNHADENIVLFYQTLNMIDAAHSKTYKDSQENLNKWISVDGTEKLAQFQIFDNTLRGSYIRNFNEAVINPDPAKGLASWTEEDINT